MIQHFKNNNLVGCSLSNKETKITGKYSSFFSDNNQTLSLSDVFKKIKEDVDFLNKVFNDVKPKIINYIKLSNEFYRTFDKDNYSDYSYDDLVKDILKFKNKKPETLIIYLSALKRNFIGVNNLFVSKDRTVIETNIQVKKSNENVVSYNLTQKDLDECVKLLIYISNIFSKIVDFKYSDLIEDFYGYDFTDPPFRGYGEVWDNQELVDIITPFGHPVDCEEVTDILKNLDNHLSLIEDAVIKLIKESVIEK